jgi:hypothetical protein
MAGRMNMPDEQAGQDETAGRMNRPDRQKPDQVPGGKTSALFGELSPDKNDRRKLLLSLFLLLWFPTGFSSHLCGRS